MTNPHIRSHLLVETENTAHRLEECQIYNEQFEPVDLSSPARNFILAIHLKGQSRWKQGTQECLLSTREIAVFRATPDLLVSRQGEQPAQCLLWHFNMQNMKAVNTALGSNGESQCSGNLWPLSGPSQMNPEQQSLVISLRCAPPTPLRNLWYSAKLLELVAILPPNLNKRSSKPSHLHPAVQYSLDTLHAHFASPPSLEELAAKAGISPTHLSHLFARETGMTLSRYLRQLRMKHASMLLRSGDCNVTETAFAVGYSSLGQFSQAFRNTYGHTPGQHRYQAVRQDLPVS